MCILGKTKIYFLVEGRTSSLCNLVTEVTYKDALFHVRLE